MSKSHDYFTFYREIRNSPSHPLYGITYDELVELYDGYENYIEEIDGYLLESHQIIFTPEGDKDED